jgi:hypothetical protein
MIILNSNQILNELVWCKFKKFASKSLFKEKKKKDYDYHRSDTDQIRIAYLQNMDIANKLTIIFHKHNLKKHGIVLN